jgi:acyl-CoA thioesterase FadM
MGFFAYPYLVTFADTMAYGTHHFITNFKFQCAAREALLFEKVVDGQKDWHEQFSETVMLTTDGYTRNMNAVPVGERVVVFMTFEEPSVSSMRLCFRTLNNKGEPVACGYQSIVCVARNGSGLVELPESFTQFRDVLEEEFKSPAFDERARRGGRWAKELFTDHFVHYAQELASASARLSYPQILEANSVSSGT